MISQWLFSFKMLSCAANMHKQYTSRGEAGKKKTWHGKDLVLENEDLKRK